VVRVRPRIGDDFYSEPQQVWSCSTGVTDIGAWRGSLRGSEVVLWEDVAILRNAGIPVRVYASAARNRGSVKVVSLRTGLPLITSLEYGGRFLLKERETVLVAYNEPSVAGWAPDRTIVRFDQTTPLPRYWSRPMNGGAADGSSIN